MTITNKKMAAGAAALMLQKEPGLNNATIKARLMKSATKKIDSNPLVRGAGSLSLPGALTATGWADVALWGDSIPEPD